MGGWGEDKKVIHIASMFKTLVFTVFSPLCTTHCAKDVEPDTLSQASMPLATMPKTRYLQRFCFSTGCGLRVAHSGLTNSISEAETQCNKE